MEKDFFSVKEMANLSVDLSRVLQLSNICCVFQIIVKGYDVLFHLLGA
jgi:hypothetical protein